MISWVCQASQCQSQSKPSRNIVVRWLFLCGTGLPACVGLGERRLEAYALKAGQFVAPAQVNTSELSRA